MMGTLNRKVLTRSLSVHQDDAEVEHICSAVSSDKRTSTPSDDLNHKDGENNIPDIVSSISESSQSQDSMEDCKDPDIVRSNSSSDESQISSHRAACRAKTSDAGQSSVSSFSSSGSSKYGSSSSQDPDRRAKRSTVGSVGSLNDLQQSKATTAREGGWTSCLYNQDSVFTQESPDMPDGSSLCRPWPAASVFRHIPSPITEADSSLTSEEHDSSQRQKCSEKGQEARNRFSSSGYGTGSSESSRGASASKTSVHVSQESFSKVDTVLRKSVESSTACSEEPTNAANILHSRAALSNSAIFSSGTNLRVQNMTKSDSLKPAFQNPSSDNRATADASISSQRTMAPSLRHVPGTVTGDPSVPLQSHTTDHRQQQTHKQHVLMNINPHQAEGQSSVVVQNVRQPQCSTAPHNIMQSQTGAVPPSVSHIQAGALSHPPSVSHIQASALSHPPSVSHIPTSALPHPPSVSHIQAGALPHPPSVSHIPTSALPHPPSVSHIPTSALPHPPSVSHIPTSALPHPPSVSHIPTSALPHPPSVSHIQAGALPHPPSVSHIQAGALPHPPSVSHIPTSALPQNIGQFQASLDPPRQSHIHSSSSVTHTAQADINSMSTYLPQQPTPASHGKLGTVYDYQYHMRQLSLQHPPPSSGSLNYTTAPMSSSSSISCIVPPSVEKRWTDEPSDVSLAKNLLQSESVVSESSGESRYHLDSLLKDRLIEKHDVAGRTSSVTDPDGARHIPVFHQLLSDSSDSSVVGDMYSLESPTNDVLPDRNLWEKLQRSARCNETGCTVPECAQIKAVMAVLQNERNDVHSLSSSLKSLLLAMFRHMAYVCDHPKCPFPWCGERVDNHDLSQDECLLIMKQRMENFAEHCRLLKRPMKYMKLKTSLPYNCMPVEEHHWVRLCMMGNSRRTLLVKPLLVKISDPLSDTEYWVIKKVYLTDEGDNWSVYSRLREIKHKSVASLLWVASCEDHMLVCSMYEGFSLSDYLPSLPASQSRFTAVFCIMQQLISAIRHVNTLGIVYLNWTSKNILVTYQADAYFLVKLSNFSCSVLLERPDGRQPCYDGGYLLLALPWQLVTPELRDDFTVEFVSDVWGIGCLLHELATGYPIWHEHRHHIDQDFVKSLVRKPPQIPDTCPELMEMFAACWQPDPSKRVPMCELEIMLIQAFSHHLGS